MKQNIVNTSRNFLPRGNN